MKKTISLVWVSFLLVTGAGADELVPEDFARALVLETGGGAAIYEVSLPDSVYETVVRRDLGDIRVFNANEEAVPHAIRIPRKTENTEQRIKLPVFPLYGAYKNNSRQKLAFTIDDDGTILTLREGDNVIVSENARIKSYIIDASHLARKAAALEFELSGSGDNYVKKLSIEQGRDLNQWRPLVSRATLTRLKYGSHELRENRVKLPRNHDRYLRLNWQDASDGLQPVSVFAILMDREKGVKPVWRSRAGELVDAERLVYEFDNGGDFPVEQFNIDLAESNTLIEATISSRSNDEENWKLRHRGLFYRLAVEGNQIQNDVVIIRTVDDRYWQLKVSTDDGMGNTPPRLDFGWTGHSLLFLARGPGPFILAYGSGKAGPTGRPVAALVDVLDNKRHAGFTDKARIISAQELSGDAARDRHFDISWQRSILWLVLAAGVLVLGIMSYRLIRQMQE